MSRKCAGAAGTRGAVRSGARRRPRRRRPRRTLSGPDGKERYAGAQREAALAAGGARHCGGDHARIGHHVDPDRRAEIANHANAAGLPEPARFAETAAGVHLFVSSLAPAASRRAFLPWKTAQAAWITRSLALAGVLNSALDARGHDGDARPHGAARTRQHDLPRGRRLRLRRKRVSRRTGDRRPTA